MNIWGCKHFKQIEAEVKKEEGNAAKVEAPLFLKDPAE